MTEEIEALATRIDELEEAGRKARNAACEAGNTSEGLEFKSLHRQLRAEMKAAQDKLASIFAAQHGWKQSMAEFSIGCLAARTTHGHGCPTMWPNEMIDHPDWFRENRRAAAVVGHLYEIPDNAEAWAQEHGLKVEISDFPSWYWPKACKLVIYTPASSVNLLGKGVARTRDVLRRECPRLTAG